MAAVAETIWDRVEGFLFFLVWLVAPDCRCMCSQSKEQSNDIGKEQQRR